MQFAGCILYLHIQQYVWLKYQFTLTCYHFYHYRIKSIYKENIIIMVRDHGDILYSHLSVLIQFNVTMSNEILWHTISCAHIYGFHLHMPIGNVYRMSCTAYKLYWYTMHVFIFTLGRLSRSPAPRAAHSNSPFSLLAAMTCRHRHTLAAALTSGTLQL